MSSLFRTGGIPESAFTATGGVAALTTFVLGLSRVSAIGRRCARVARKTAASARRSVTARLDARKVRKLPVTAPARVRILRNPTTSPTGLDDPHWSQAQIMTEQRGHRPAATRA